MLGLGGQILSAVVVRGLQPSADGRWLLTGQFHLEGAPTSRGFLFRFGTDGALAGTLVPEFPNSTAVETANAHEQDGVIRFLAVIHGAAGFHLATVRTDSALSGAFFDTTWGQMASRPTLGKGRFIGNQTLVAPVWFLGQSPGLVVVKPGQLQVVTLPAEPMGGNGIPNQSVEQTLAATASGATGVLVAAGLQDGEGLGAGIYVARVDLRGGTPRVDTEFGDGGAKRIGWQPAGGGCLPGENAHVQLGALVSWQQANLVLGTSRTACPWSGDTSFFGMRVVAAPLLSDGFE